MDDPDTQKFKILVQEFESLDDRSVGIVEYVTDPAGTRPLEKRLGTWHGCVDID